MVYMRSWSWAKRARMASTATSNSSTGSAATSSSHLPSARRTTRASRGTGRAARRRRRPPRRRGTPCTRAAPRRRGRGPWPPPGRSSPGAPGQPVLAAQLQPVRRRPRRREAPRRQRRLGAVARRHRVHERVDGEPRRQVHGDVAALRQPPLQVAALRRDRILPINQIKTLLKNGKMLL